MKKILLMLFVLQINYIYANTDTEVFANFKDIKKLENVKNVTTTFTTNEGLSQFTYKSYENNLISNFYINVTSVGLNDDPYTMNYHTNYYYDSDLNKISKSITFTNDGWDDIRTVNYNIKNNSISENIEFPTDAKEYYKQLPISSNLIYQYLEDDPYNWVSKDEYYINDKIDEVKYLMKKQKDPIIRKYEYINDKIDSIKGFYKKTFSSEIDFKNLQTNTNMKNWPIITKYFYNKNTKDSEILKLSDQYKNIIVMKNDKIIIKAFFSKITPLTENYYTETIINRYNSDEDLISQSHYKNLDLHKEYFVKYLKYDERDNWTIQEIETYEKSNKYIFAHKTRIITYN